MLFWKPVGVLLRLRFQAARNQFAQSPTPALWTVLMAIALALAALGRGNRVSAQWTLLPMGAAEAALRQAWLLMQALWLSILLLPGVVSLLSYAPPPAVLRPFALRPLQILASEVLAGLADIPAILALLLTLPLIAHLLAGGQWAQASVVIVAFGLLCVQTNLLARGLVYFGMWGARRLRRWAEVPALAVFLLLGLCVGMPPAFASLTGATSPEVRLAPFAAPSVSPALFAPLLPSTTAARAVTCTRCADVGGVAGALSRLIVCLGLTGSGALLALRGANGSLTESAGRTSAPTTKPRNAERFRLRAKSLPQGLYVVVTEWRLLLRAPHNYLRLRKPASVLLLCVFAFLSPDMSRNPVYNVKEFLGVGALLYNVLWQMQLLCNRFGNEAGTGSLLFGFSVPRRTLLLGKNAALLLLLLCLDGPAIAGLCVVAGFPGHIPCFLLWLPLILMVLTSLGNVVSILRPFAIASGGKRKGVEPPEALSAGYIVVGCLAVLLLVPVGRLVSLEQPFAFLGVVGAISYVAGGYALSLYAASVLLAKQEYKIIAALDGFGE